MTWFTENPTPVVILGILIEAALAVVLMKTGRRGVLWAMPATAAFAASAILASFLIVTPREEVTAALEEMRLLVERNDRAELVARIDPQAVSLRNQVQSDQMYLTVDQAKINDLKITVDDSATSSRADFVGVINFRDTGGRLPYNKVIMQFRVTLKKVDGKWILTSADYGPIGSSGAGGSAGPSRDFSIRERVVG